MRDPRAEALRIFRAGVAAADPYAAVTDHLAEVPGRPALIIAVGKAAGRMAAAALAAFPGTACIIVTNYENAQPVEGAKVFAAGHPVPDANGAAAAEVVITALSAADGPVLALISGGGSALLPAPAGEITLADKAALNAALLASGLDITAMNLVRQQVSRLKGGGMLRLAAPWPVTALILSDVVGDDLSAIASGPTAPPLGDRRSACNLLKERGIWGELPASVRAHLSAPDMPVILPEAQNVLVGSNRQSLAAMQAAAPGAICLSAPIVGDVAEAAKVICAQCGLGITLWGGETTVRLKGTGRGGRNQELALRIAREAARLGWTEWTCLQAGSDGRDGPTDAAGGVVNEETLRKINELGGDLDAMLTNNDSYAALEMVGDLLKIEATGTNVADLGVMIRKG